MTVSYLNDTDPEAVDPADGPREALGRFAELGGFTLTVETNPWYAAAEAVTGPEDARSASTLLAELRSLDVAATRAAVTALAPEGSLGDLDTLVALGLVTGVLQRIHGTAARLHPDAYDADLDALVAATAGSRWRKEQGVKLSWLQRRALRGLAKRLTVGKRGRRADVHEALSAAVAERADWTALAGATRPAVPTDATRLAEAAQAVDALAQAARALGRLLPGHDLEATPLADLADLIDRLAADEGTLYRLPTLRELRATLAGHGLDPLVAELTGRQADRETALAAYDREFAPAAEAPAPAPAAVPAQAASPEAVPEAAPEPVEEVAAEVVAEPVADAIPEPEPVAVVEPEPEPEPEPELVVEPEIVVVPEAVVEPVAVAVAAVEPEAEPEPELVAVVADAPAAAERPKRVRRPKKPEIIPGRAVTAYSAAELAALVRWIDTDGDTRTEDELLRAAMKELGFARLGPRIKEALSAAIADARS
ncbi:hypothetical protein [Kitasatospora sp. McL0602]|uniref:hypothetical protein n=1 Tax=Kitasatospora sp. McL0602 TaxID=3439530 RepID=UPI003F8964A9